MKKVNVVSENLKAVGYEPGEEWLVVDFRNGRSYRYLNVPQKTFDGLLAASSKGTYFNQQIKDRFKFVRLI
jgi:hypothetical protein